MNYTEIIKLAEMLKEAKIPYYFFDEGVQYHIYYPSKKIQFVQ